MCLVVLSLSLTKIDCRYVLPYMTTFFSLPVKRQSGERLSHEEVVNKLDDETVSYSFHFGISETLEVSIQVEVATFETAVAWLHDLLYGSEFCKERCLFLSISNFESCLTYLTCRIQIAVAKLEQKIPAMKRDGSTVLDAIKSDTLFSETSTAQISGLLKRIETIPKLAKQIQDAPEEVVHAFEQIRKYSA
jgi:hypothetical protein